MTDQEMTPDKEALSYPWPIEPICSNCGTNDDYQTKCCALVKTLRAENEKLKLALNKICSVTQFDHPTSQIIGSEEYECAWLDCVEIAKEALACSK
jgi:hypothetical protein